jgi:hypothetical protein
VGSLKFVAILSSFTTADDLLLLLKKISLERAAVVPCAGQMAAMTVAYSVSLMTLFTDTKASTDGDT